MLFGLCVGVSVGSVGSVGYLQTEGYKIPGEEPSLSPHDVSALHCTSLHYTACNALHYTALHCTELNCTALCVYIRSRDSFALCVT